MTIAPWLRLNTLQFTVIMFMVHFPASGIEAQVSITRADFYSIVTPGRSNSALVPEPSVATVNLGGRGGPNIYDFSSIPFAVPSVSRNFFVDSIPLLAARYPSGAVTFGAATDTIADNPILVFTHDTLFQAGNATLGDKFRFRHFTPFPPLMPFPANYGQSYSRTASYADSTFDLSWHLVTAIQTEQPSSCVVDGYGTLKIPGHEAACLRLNIDFPKYNEKELLYISDGGFLVNIDLSGVTSDTGIVPFDGMGILIAGAPTDVRHEARIAGGFALFQNYPNPFNPKTVIRGQWTMDSRVRLSVFDLLGREVAVLAEGRYPAGRYSFSFDGTQLASGTYLYRLTAGEFVATRRMILVR